MSQDRPHGVSRRHFARLLAGGAAAALAPVVPSRARAIDPPWPRRVGQTDRRDESYWQQVREQFVMPLDLAVLNAANLCPSSKPVLDTLYEATRDVDRDPSQQNRRKLSEGKEAARRTAAAFLGVTPEEIVLTRNTSEANNIVSSGLDLHAGDEVVIFGDNHPSNQRAWTDKAERFGFTVRVVDQVNPHPGGEYYLDAFTRASNARTKLWAFTHVTNSVGDLFPVTEMCAAARARGILTLVDGAQTFGVLDLDLAALGADFYSGSGHKWPCGPRETGVLFVRQAAQARLHPSIVSLYAGSVGISRTFEGLGQRDEPAIVAFGKALEFQSSVGKTAIAARSRALAEALMDGLGRIEGVKIWTHPDPDRSWSVVSFQPAGLDPGRLSTALYETDRIACATRGGQDRPGLRFSPHFYNLQSEVDRAVAAVAKYVKNGV